MLTHALAYVCALCGIYPARFDSIWSTAGSAVTLALFRFLFLSRQAALTSAPRFEFVPNYASNSILGPPRQRLPSSLVIESPSASTLSRLPTVRAEALPMNANDYSFLIRLNFRVADDGTGTIR